MRRGANPTIAHPGAVTLPAVVPIVIGDTMPDLTGKPKRLLMPLLARKDIKVRMSGEGYVVSQSPAPGAAVTHRDRAGPGVSVSLLEANLAALRRAFSRTGRPRRVRHGGAGVRARTGGLGRTERSNPRRRMASLEPRSAGRGAAPGGRLPGRRRHGRPPRPGPGLPRGGPHRGDGPRRRHRRRQDENRARSRLRGRSGALRAAFRVRDLSALLADERLGFVAGGEPEGLISALELSGGSNAAIFELTAATSAHPSWFERARRAAERWNSKGAVNENTLRRFGRLWVRNLARNLGRCH